MGKLQDFFMANEAIGETTTEVEISPFPHPFVIRSITEGENKAIRKSCQKVTIDKKTKVRQTETNSDEYNNRLIVACCVDPNFKDAELQKKFGVIGAEALIDKILNPGQYIDLLLAVQELNGFSDDVNDLIDEAKN
ncbi:hypothetical protein CE91St46_01680 [Eubacteriales bacterium]|nr:hypothetical protein [Oscillospiraceae bacterium]MBS1380700.1 hypothetical protein [Oscillospiraceae bacterium]GKH49057.1 hypothetical protein CE91St46_01680 [Eubacteriales bacterium]GKH61698.1 hypothetical protein CE91St47_01670 [Eubacteriales bacterium]